MSSIRKQLLLSILSVITVVTMLLAAATYFSVRNEMDELYDENMRQVAVVLANTGLEDEAAAVAHVSSSETLNGEEEFLIQIWRDGVLEYTSHPAIRFELQTIDGFGQIPFNERDWRFYRLDHDRNIIQIAQDLHKRHGVVAEIFHVLLVPIFIQYLLLGILIWFLVGYGLKPLARISGLIEKRTAAFLEPLPDDHAPVEIKSLVNALNDLLMRLKQALDSHRRFTSDAAHELRTPLTAVRLQLDILKRAQDAQEKDEAISTLEKGVSRSIRLVQQLLELARQEPGNMPHVWASVNLGDVIAEVIEQLTSLARQKHISVQTEIGEDLVLQGNAPQLAVMIGNLVNNAILYTPEHGRVLLTGKRENGHIVLDVADNGIGIPEKDRARIFDRFYRVAGMAATGSGLGLSIVTTIALAHGIDISLRDGLDGKGVTIRLMASLNAAPVV